MENSTKYEDINEPQLQRRLAALISADVVGYSRLMADDEFGTVRSLSL